MHKAINIFKKIFYGLDDNKENGDLRAVSFLFGICIVTGMIYYYNNNIISLMIFAILTFIIQAGAYLLFDFISKKKLIGTVLYLLAFIIISFLANTLITLQQSIGLEGLDAEVPFFFWFLTPQSAMPYFPFYTYAIFLLASFFISSTVYYFTMITYRTIMTFLLLLIPLAIYAKELHHIPLILILLLFILYFSIMILNTTKKKHKDIKSFKYYKTIFCFLLGSIVIITLMPKPTIIANRDYIENIISANELTSRLMGTLNKMNNKSDGGMMLNFQSDKILFYVKSDEAINLKARVLEDYDYDNDSWSIEGRYIYKSFDNYSKNLNPNKFINLIEKVCKDNQEFVDKYNLNEFLNSKEVDDCIKDIFVEANNLPAEYALVPTGLSRLPSIDVKDLIATTAGEVVIRGLKPFDSKNKYELEYYSEDIIYTEKMNKLITQFKSENYREFLNDLETEVVKYWGDEHSIIYSHYYTYEEAVSFYNDTYQEPSNKILNLAKEITKDKHSDYEKAKAIEEYFHVNNFTYDLEFRKNAGDNVENFLFESKTGVCYEYATAMVILARAVGLPARYVEGFSVSNYSEKNGLYIVTARESHAFPEVYISGYGWMSFEPTVATEQIDIVLSARKKLMFFMQVSMLIIFMISIALSVIFIPRVMESIFRLNLRKYSYGERIIRIFKKLKVMFKFSESMTAKEMTGFFTNKYDVDFSISETIFNKYVYGDLEITELEFAKVYEQYSTLFSHKKAEDKNQKRLKIKSIFKVRG